jgi:2-polyprenyl-6-methoxyphenol hydroxylase-like FAD-dependent oxidoreductase
MNIQHTPVLIVGGGLGGLSTAMFLGLNGVPSMLVERHASTANQPKARGQMPPTMEALRAAGVADQVMAETPPGRPEMTIVIAESVTGRVLHNFTEAMPDFSRFSPERIGMASQERAEPILATRAAEFGADLRFRTELRSFTDGPDGITALLRDLRTGQDFQVLADYLAGADGHRGRVREAAGIGAHGRGTLGAATSLLFEADLNLVLDGAAVHMHYLQNPELPGSSGTFVSTDTPGRYVVGVGQGDSELTDERATELIRIAVGVPDLMITLIDVNDVSAACRVADRFSTGRVHLVGDAAHVMPPHGGQGGNTAVMDGYHLGWKLAAVVKGEAGPGLLASHDAERRPFADFLVEQQYANMVQRQAPHLADDTVAEIIDPAVGLFGYRCPSGAFVAEPGDHALFEDPAAPTGRPGCRAPHVPLRRDGQSLSTRYLYGRNFVLLTGDDGATWEVAAKEAAQRLGLTIIVCRIGANGLIDTDGLWASRHGVSESGAVLVRPDGVIAWRTAGAGEAGAVERALRTVLDR